MSAKETHGLHHPPIRHQSRKKIRSQIPQTGRHAHRQKRIPAQDGCRRMGSGQRDHREKLGAYIDPQAGRRLVEDFWHPWLAAKKTKAKPSYVKSLEDAWRVHVMPQWGVREVQSITRGEVQRWVTDLAGRRSASVTIRAENLLRNLLERAKEDKCIHDNPCDNIELPRKQRRRHVYLAADELSRVALHCGWRELSCSLSDCAACVGANSSPCVWRTLTCSDAGSISGVASPDCPARWWRRIRNP